MHWCLTIAFEVSIIIALDQYFIIKIKLGDDPLDFNLKNRNTAEHLEGHTFWARRGKQPIFGFSSRLAEEVKVRTDSGTSAIPLKY